MTDFSKGAAFIEGEQVAIADAKIPLMDWGFLHSDATYDVAHTWKGRFFRVDEYIERFEASMAKLRMSIPYDRDQIREIMFDLVRLTGLRDSYVEIVCTRGIPAPGSRDPRQCQNRFLAFVVPFVWIANDELRATGLNLLISKQQRIPPASVDPTIKNYHWLDMVMALFEAYDHGADTAILVDARGDLTEGPGFNIFARHGDTVTSPEHGVLHGVTRMTLLELMERQNLRINRGRLTADAARAADELFITSTAGGVMPVTRIDGQMVGNGRPGSLVHTLNDEYWALHEDPAYSIEIEY
jgi:branched-chain amino acid aminotransferase